MKAEGVGRASDKKLRNGRQESPGLRGEGGRRMKKEGVTRTRVGKTEIFIQYWGGGSLLLTSVLPNSPCTIVTIEMCLFIAAGT